MVSYESIYPGATFLLDPEYQSQGYNVAAADIGATTSIQTANQLKEVNNLLNQGIQTTEVSTINPEVFEMMPKDHLKEIHRLNKLTGAESTLHAPTLDPSGFTQQGWSKSNRVLVEKQFSDFVERSHELSPDGSMPVTIHASVIPGSEMMPAKGPLIKKEEKGKKEVMQKMIAVDQETGQFIPLERDVLYSQHKKGPEINTPQERLDMANNSKWIQAVTNLGFYKKEADEVLRNSDAGMQQLKQKMEAGEKITTKDAKQFKQIQQYQLGKTKLFLDNVDTSFRTLFEQAAKYPHEEPLETRDGRKIDAKKHTKKVLNHIREDYAKHRKMLVNEYRKADREGREVDNEKIVLAQSRLVDQALTNLREIPSPMQYKKVEEFAKDKASETLSNVAVNAYKKFGAKAPIISIENPPYGSAISDAENLKGLIKKTRRKFVQKLVNQGRSKSEAQKQAKRLIGATWDTSHISMMRKQGFGKDKITAETRKIAPYVKHVHLNDNFGSTHTDLPPGKGNLPMSEIIKELDKAKFKGKKIFEGGGFFQHFQTSPMPQVLEGVGSPLYSTGGVTWNQVGGLGNYYGGQGPINTPIHHSTYGAGFTTLPADLGGEMAGGQSRFAGTPNQ